jgi:hypothetical protein
MWTRKDINDFKELIRKEESDAIIKVGTNLYSVEVVIDDVKCVCHNHSRLENSLVCADFYPISIVS